MSQVLAPKTIPLELEGNGILCGVKNGNRYIGFVYVCYYKNAANYASASDDPDFKNYIPISHILQWKIVEYLKKRGCDYYEMGLQQFGAQIYNNPSRKDLDISFFKRGFGGLTLPLYQGIKYYDKEYMKEDLEHCVDQLLISYKNNANL